MAKYWMHNGLMRAGRPPAKCGGRSRRRRAAATIDTKISRSKGAGGLADLIAQQTGERIRFFLLRTHYRSTIVFDHEGLREAGTALESFYRFFERYQRLTKSSFFELDAPQQRADYAAPPSAPETEEFLAEVAKMRSSFLYRMDDDFNTGAAISVLFDLLKALNRFADARIEKVEEVPPAALSALEFGARTLRELSQILGLFETAPAKATAADGLSDPLMRLLVDIRTAARSNKDFATADKVRDALTAGGITLEDHKGETTWRVEETGGVVDTLMQLLIELREAARTNKDFATADKVRDELAALKITLEDHKGETTWRRED